ncbi:MAG: SDR family oxidoreductase [Anaerolineae bacterium]|nr:SDR family oxidoreductase [Anaerolineae bacterium]
MSTHSNAKSVVITGASTGIGRACALYLDQHGLRVFAGVRKQADADDLRQAASEHLTPVFINVTDTATIATAAEQVRVALQGSGLAGLINNAGVAFGGPLEFLPIEKLKTQLEINVIGQVAVTQAFLPLLRPAQGRIINMSSISGRLAMPFLGPYAASKFALEALTDSLRLELKPWGIEVVSIEPGAIKTPIWDKSVAEAHSMVEELPPQAKTLYGPVMERLVKTITRTGEAGIPAEAVAKVVAEALLTPQPKTRYLVGRNAKFGALLARFLPDRLRDKIVLKRRG